MASLSPWSKFSGLLLAMLFFGVIQLRFKWFKKVMIPEFGI